MNLNVIIKNWKTELSLIDRALQARKALRGAAGFGHASG
jgi:hypothetical protein